MRWVFARQGLRVACGGLKVIKRDLAVKRPMTIPGVDMVVALAMVADRRGDGLRRRSVHAWSQGGLATEPLDGKE